MLFSNIRSFDSDLKANQCQENSQEFRCIDMTNTMFSFFEEFHGTTLDMKIEIGWCGDLVRVSLFFAGIRHDGGRAVCVQPTHAITSVDIVVPLRNCKGWHWCVALHKNSQFKGGVEACNNLKCLPSHDAYTSMLCKQKLCRKPTHTRWLVLSEGSWQIVIETDTENTDWTVPEKSRTQEWISPHFPNWDPSCSSQPRTVSWKRSLPLKEQETRVSSS